MSTLFLYICTQQTADPYIPPATGNAAQFQRNVSDSFFAMQGGYRTVGKLALFPLQKAVPFHLLCDGSEVPKTTFPELYDYLGDLMGTPADANNFVLPNYIGEGALTAAATAVTETVEGGTVTSEPSSPGTGNSGGSVDKAVDSGGRVRLTSI